MNQMHLDFSKQQLPNLSYALNDDEEHEGDDREHGGHVPDRKHF